jgi:pimeloyl-ACP methyl ester carboxylesterase
MKLVFLHGAGCSSLSFYYQLRHFRNSKAIDLPGHPDGTACPDIDSYLEWTRGFITARRYKDVVLCGHSMGGAIALQYALNYPDELKGIILLGTGARLRVHPQYLERAREPGENNASWLAGHLKYYKKVQPDIYQVVEQRAGQIGPSVELNDLLACDQFDVMDQVHDIKLPAQVICGSEDAMTPVKYANYLAKKIKGSRKSIIPNGTHFVQMEKYQQVNEAIEGFLVSLKSQGSSQGATGKQLRSNGLPAGRAKAVIGAG